LYQLEKERAITYLDYKWLGLKVEGAPDGTNKEVFKYLFRDDTRCYPTRIYYRPHWFDIQLETLSDQDYFIWLFLETCTFEHHPVSEEVACWRDHIGVQQTWLEHYAVLQKFKRLDIIPQCSAAVEKEIKRLSDKKGHQVIHDIELDYPVELELINLEYWTIVQSQVTLTESNYQRHLSSGIWRRESRSGSQWVDLLSGKGIFSTSSSTRSTQRPEAGY
jgi:hypothetical protein